MGRTMRTKHEESVKGWNVNIERKMVLCRMGITMGGSDVRPVLLVHRRCQ